ncbi:MAG: glycosyltransferase family 2 protein [Thermodesulfobacteriota bacterium]|nr:glycosyltransferase family 2 protein [Thermodesulfobacteriota bacterium]
MKLSVIMPAFNEARTLPEILRRVLDVPLDMEKEVLVVDDGSTDETADFLKTLDDPRIKVLRHARNQGKGAAVRTALALATGDIILIQDADLECDPKDYPKLIEPIASGRFRVVYGSRVLSRSPRLYHRYYWGGRFLSFLANVLYRMNITDEPSGYKVFRSDVLKSFPLKCEGFDFCPEVTAHVGLRKIPVCEVPISYSPRSFSQGKKTRWRDGWIAIKVLVRHRFRP